MRNYEGEFEKQPEEKLQVIHDFTSVLDATEVISTVSVACIQVDTEQSASACIAVGGTGKTDKTIYYGAIGGTDGKDYKFSVSISTNKTVGTSDGVVMKVEHLMKVRAR